VPGRRPATARHGSLDLRLLRAFVEVERFGSITEAAAALGYSQPGLSQRIQSLERRTGRRLFDRRAQGVSLTPEGVVLLPLARVMLAVDSEIRTALGRPDG
jgi:DNA-binding transcriptional LysR family regulator